MAKDLFQLLGIDPSLPLETIREELEEKNLEYLEKLDACGDGERAKEIQEIQQAIEAAIKACDDGTLPRPAEGKPKGNTKKAAAAPAPTKFEKGYQLYLAGNLTKALPLLKGEADQGDVPACRLTAEIFRARGDNTNYRRYLFNAARQDDGEAALLLAQDYYKNEEKEQARKWAERALGLGIAGSGQLLLRLYGEDEEWVKALVAAREELKLPAEDEDKFALCKDIRELLDGNHYSDGQIVELVGPMVVLLDDVPAAQKWLDEPYQIALDKERRVRAKAEQEKRRKEEKRQAEERERQRRQKAEMWARIRQEGEAAKAAQEAAKAKKKKTILTVIFALLLAAGAAGGYYYFTEMYPAEQYAEAEVLLTEKDYVGAETVFAALGEYKDAPERLQAAQRAHYSVAKQLEREGRTAAAAVSYGQLGEYRDALQKSRELWLQVYPYSIAFNTNSHPTDIYAVLADGSVSGMSGGQKYEMTGWEDIVAVAGSRGRLLGLKLDGTVAIKEEKAEKNRETAAWTNVIAIAGSGVHDVGLLTDGTVVTSGENGQKQCETDSWKNIVAIAANDHCTVGLRANGTVVSTDGSTKGWSEIKAVACGDRFVLGLRQDGTVVVSEGVDEEMAEAIATWEGVAAIAAGSDHAVGFRWDCSVVAAGENGSEQCEVAGWNVAGVAAGGNITVGLQWDGTGVTAGTKYGGMDLSGLRMPGAPWAEKEAA